jgi:hypothetical protein
MAPTTSEEELERQLAEVTEDYKDSADRLSSLRREMSRQETLHLELRLRADRLTEELRVFRAMYPRLCRRDK